MPFAVFFVCDQTDPYKAGHCLPQQMPSKVHEMRTTGGKKNPENDHCEMGWP